MFVGHAHKKTLLFFLWMSYLTDSKETCAAEQKEDKAKGKAVLPKEDAPQTPYKGKKKISRNSLAIIVAIAYVGPDSSLCPPIND